MGISILGGSSGKWDPNEGKIVGNPDPTNFKIVQLDSYGANTVAVVHYPDAISYEGMKVLVFQGVTLAEVRRLEKIDPHFRQTGVAPFARFEPTEEGLHAARLLAKNMPPTKGNREPLRVCEVCGRIRRVISYSNRVCGDCAMRVPE